MAEQAKSALAINLEKLAKLILDNPLCTHVYLRRADGTQVDIPVKQVEYTLRNNPDWTVDDTGIMEGKPSSGDVTLHSESVVVPPKPSEASAAGTPIVQKPPVNARMARAKLEELALAEGATQEEIDAAESRDGLVELVNAKRAAGTPIVQALTMYEVLLEGVDDAAGDPVAVGDSVELDPDAEETKEWLTTAAIKVLEKPAE